MAKTPEQHTVWMKPEDVANTSLSSPALKQPRKDAAEAAWTDWKKSPDPAKAGKLLAELKPTIETALKSYAPGMEESLRTRARLLALDAAGRFDPAEGAKLSSFVHGSLQKLHRVRADREHLVHIPENVGAERAAIERVSKEIESEFGREPTVEELCDRTGLSKRRLEKVSVYAPTLSDSAFLSDQGSTLYERPRDASSMWVDYVYDELDPVDKKVFEWSTGYGGRQKLKKGEIAQRLKVSAPAVSARISRIAKKLEEGYSLGSL